MVALLFSASMTCSPTWMPSPVPAVANSPPLLVITVPLLTVRVPMVSCAKAGKARAAVAASTTLASVFMRFILKLGGQVCDGFHEPVGQKYANGWEATRRSEEHTSELQSRENL